MEANLDIHLLGPLEVVIDGRPVELGGTQRRALLAVLLLNANQVVSTDRLIDELWGDQPPPTAAHTIQVHVSQLRKQLGDASAIVATQRPGYVARVEPAQLDLHRFEALLEDGREALGRGDAEEAAAVLRRALDLWRGQALADFTFEPFAQAAINRLEELRLVALEERIDADLALGRHAALVGELEALVGTNLLRERPRGQLMLALYRSGRQAEALEAYQETRRTLVDELGIDPSPALQELEKAILNQDPGLVWSGSAPADEAVKPTLPTSERSILVLSEDADELGALLMLSEPLARSQSPHELILARLVGDPGELGDASSELREQRAQLLARNVPARAAAFTSADSSADLVRLASQQEVDLLLLAETDAAFSPELRSVLEEAPCDVAIVANRPLAQPSGAAVVVPFGAGDHDWGALELGTWAASAHGLPLRLVGVKSEDETRDASRLLASAGLVVQQLAGVDTDSVLVGAGPEGVLEASEDAIVVVVGLSERWHEEGLGPVRSAVARASRAPVIFVRRGPRPGGLSPRDSLTRFTWSLAMRAETGRL
jgi:DNA-binding SARP family transcriptional activator